MSCGRSKENEEQRDVVRYKQRERRAVLLFYGGMIAVFFEAWFLAVEGKVWGVGVEDVRGDGILVLLVFAEDSMC